jgi:hypothetical protein
MANIPVNIAVNILLTDGWQYSTSIPKKPDKIIIAILQNLFFEKIAVINNNKINT